MAFPSSSLEKLPSELVSQIFTHLQNSRWESKAGHDLLALCLTSKTCLAHAQPLLYQHVVLSPALRFEDPSETEPSLDNSTEMQLRTYLTTPFLLDYARSLTVEVANPVRYSFLVQDFKLIHQTARNSHVWKRVQNMLVQFQHIRRLQFTLQWVTQSDLTFSLLTIALESMEKIQTLFIKHLTPSQIPILLKHLKPLTQLRELNLSPLFAESPGTEPMLEKETPLNLSVTEILFFNTSVSEVPTIVNYMLYHCQNVQKLSWTCSMRMVWSTKMILKDVLEPARLTIREIDFSGWPDYEYPDVDLHQIGFADSHFPALNHYRLSGWFPSPDESPEALYKQLLSGNITKLDWLFEQPEVHYLLEPARIQRIREAFGYAKRFGTQIKTFCLLVTLLHPIGGDPYFSYEEIEHIQRELAGLEKDLKEMNIRCYVELEIDNDQC